MSKRLLTLILPAVLLVGLAGCGPAEKPTGEISGKVTTSDGAPVTGGTIGFITPNGAVSAPIKPDGTFTATNVPLGDAQVTVETTDPNKPKPVYGVGPGASGGGGGGPGSTGGKMNPVNPGGGGGGGGAGGKVEPHKTEVTKPPEGVVEQEKGAYVPVDEKYATTANTPLKHTVVPGKQSADFTVEKPSKKTPTPPKK